jgi:hypothetical protein
MLNISSIQARFGHRIAVNNGANVGEIKKVVASEYYSAESGYACFFYFLFLWCDQLMQKNSHILLILFYKNYWLHTHPMEDMRSETLAHT